MMYAIARNDNNNASASSVDSGSTNNTGGGGGNFLKPSSTTTTPPQPLPTTSHHHHHHQRHHHQQQESSSSSSSNGQLITATVEKYYKEEKLGISITEDHASGSSMIISRISEDSTFQFSDLEVGMKVISINGVNLVIYAEYNGPKAAIRMAQSILKESIGQIVIVAEKNNKKGSNNNNRPAPSSSSSGNNNNSASTTTNTSSTSSRKTKPETTTKNKNNNIVVVKVYKQYQDEKLGISVKRNSDTGKFYVSNIDPTASPFLNTRLKVEMRILSINGIEITGESVSFAVLLLKDSIGEIVIEAEEVNDESLDTKPSAAAARSSRRQQQQQSRRRPPHAEDDGLMPQRPSRPSSSGSGGGGGCGRQQDNDVVGLFPLISRQNCSNLANYGIIGDEFSIAAASFVTRSNAPMEPYYVPRREQNYYGPQRQKTATTTVDGLLGGGGFDEEEEESAEEILVQGDDVAAGGNNIGIISNTISPAAHVTTTTFGGENFVEATATTTTTMIQPKIKAALPTSNPAPPAQQQVQPTTYVTQEVVNGHVIVIKRTVYGDGIRPDKIEKRIVEQARTTDDGMQQPHLRRTSQQQQQPMMEKATPAAPAAPFHHNQHVTTTLNNNKNNNAGGMVNYGDPDAATITAPFTLAPTAATTTTITTNTTTYPPAATTTTTTNNTMSNKITTTTTTKPTTTTAVNSSSTSASKYMIIPAQQQWSVVGSTTTADGKPAYIGASMDAPPAINEIDNLFAIAIAQQKHSNNVTTSDVNQYVFIFSSEEVEIDECTILAGGGWYHITTKQAWTLLTRRALAKSLKYSQTSLMHVIWLRVCSLVFAPGMLIMIPIMIAHGRKSGKMRRFCKLSQRRTTTMDGPSGQTQHKHFENRYAKFYQSDGSWKVPIKMVEKFRRN